MHADSRRGCRDVYQCSAKSVNCLLGGELVGWRLAAGWHVLRYRQRQADKLVDAKHDDCTPDPTAGGQRRQRTAPDERTRAQIIMLKIEKSRRQSD